MKFKNVLNTLMLLLSCGCGGPTELEQTASRLSPGMDKTEVKQMFADFQLSWDETNKIYEVQHATKFYNTDKQCASLIIYSFKKFHSFEVCALYFNTNGVIIAHYYKPNG